MADPYDFIAQQEGFRPKAYWDNKQWSIGYGTRAAGPDETIDQIEGQRRLRSEADKFGGLVDKNFPGLDPTKRAALTSFTYNLGPGWMTDKSRLSAAVQAGDWNTAARVMQEYNNANGQPNAGLTARRQRESAMLLGGDPSAQPPPTFTPTGRSMPYDDQTGRWIPEDEIKANRAFGSQMWQLGENAPGSKYSGIVGALRGLGLTTGDALANRATRSNQDMQSSAIRNAAEQPNLKGMAQFLLKSDVPALQLKGAGIMEQMGLRQAEQQEKMDLWTKLLSDENAAGQKIGVGPAVGAPQPQAGAPRPLSPVPGVLVNPASPQAASAGPPASPAAPQALESDNPNFWQPPPPRPMDARDKKIVAAQMAGMPKEVAQQLRPDRNYQEAHDKESGQLFAKRLDEHVAQFQKLSGQRDQLQFLSTIAKDPSVLQGPGAESISLRLRKVADFFGMPNEGLSNTQVFNSLMSKLALESRSTGEGTGMPGAMSDRDLQFLQTMAGGLPNTPQANAMLLGIRQRIIDRQQQVTKLAINYAYHNQGRFDLGFYPKLAKWAEERPLFTDKDWNALKASAGQGGNAEAAPAGQAAPTAQAAPTMVPKTKTQLDAAPVGTIDSFIIEGEPVRMEKQKNGDWKKVGMGQEAGIAWGGIKEDIAKSPAADFLRWLESNIRQGRGKPAPPSPIAEGP